MDNKNVKTGNKTSTSKSETQDNLDKRNLISIYEKNGRLEINWRGLNSIQVEQLLLAFFGNMVRYNTQKVIEEKDKPKIIKPNLTQIAGLRNASL